MDNMHEIKKKKTVYDAITLNMCVCLQLTEKNGFLTLSKTLIFPYSCAGLAPISSNMSMCCAEGKGDGDQLFPLAITAMR